MKNHENPPLGHYPPVVPQEIPPDMNPFWDLWRAEQFWACHEALESIWRQENGPRKWFLAGLINGAVAVFQHRRGNFVGAARQLERTRVKLEGFVPTYEGLDVQRFIREVAIEVAPSLVKLTAAQEQHLRKVAAEVRMKMARSGLI